MILFENGKHDASGGDMISGDEESQLITRKIGSCIFLLPTFDLPVQFKRFLRNAADGGTPSFFKEAGESFCINNQ